MDMALGLCTVTLTTLMAVARPAYAPLADIGGPPIEAVAVGALVFGGLVVAGIVLIVVFVMRAPPSRPARRGESPCAACGRPVRDVLRVCPWCGAHRPEQPGTGGPPPPLS
jgi:hypothetical protein